MGQPARSSSSQFNYFHVQNIGNTLDNRKQLHIADLSKRMLLRLNEEAFVAVVSRHSYKVSKFAFSLQIL